MWIKAPERYKRINPEPLADAPDEFDEPVEFNENGSANVSETIAQFLIDNYDEIETYENTNE